MTGAAGPVVRPARRGGLGAVLDVHARQGSRPGGPASPLERTTWDRMTRASGLTVYVAEVGGAVVGTATAMQMPNVTYGCAPGLFVEAVVVVPEHRRRGIARAMLHQVLADARASGCDKVQLLSDERHADDGAHRLYTSTGFEAEAEGFRLYLAERAGPARRTPR